MCPAPKNNSRNGSTLVYRKGVGSRPNGLGLDFLAADETAMRWSTLQCIRHFSDHIAASTRTQVAIIHIQQLTVFQRVAKILIAKILIKIDKLDRRKRLLGIFYDTVIFGVALVVLQAKHPGKKTACVIIVDESVGDKAATMAGACSSA